MIIQETNIMSGANLQPVSSPYQLPDMKSGVVIFLLSGSYEYDIEMIKKMPPPRNQYTTILIPSELTGKIGPVNFQYKLSEEDYRKKVEYLQKQKMAPQLKIIRGHNKNIYPENTYVTLSDVMKKMNVITRSLSVEYLDKNATNMLSSLMGLITTLPKRIVIIDTDRYRIYDGENPESSKSDLINGVLGEYLHGENISTKHDITFVFRSVGKEYKMDLRATTANDQPTIQKMCQSIGTQFSGSAISSQKADTLDEIMDEINADAEESDTESIGGSGSSLKQSLQHIRDALGLGEKPVQRDKMYAAKTLEINASLIRRLNPDKDDTVSDYKRISQDLVSSGDTPVEDEMIDQAAKDISTSRAPSNERSIMGTISSPKELTLRSNIGQVRLQKINLDAMSSVTDVPKPDPVRPAKITTLNTGAIRGSSFANVQQKYEAEMMDQDIIAAFMTLRKLPEGFDVLNIEVTDVSTPLTLMHNWDVTLQNKITGTKSHINIRIPIVHNSRFLYNGTYYNIGKQDFPIPVLKLNRKRAILTSNYNKIDVVRYDTKSLVDITMMLKAMASANKPDGTNPYITYGSSVAANSRFVSTIEFDEYAKRWYKFEFKDANARIIFNREECQREFGFVTVQDNEFCCGMINQVPIVINTETGLDRHGRTLTDVIASVIPDKIRTIYSKAKPNRISMYTEIKIGIKIPLGVAVAAWEGLPSLLKRSGAEYKYVSPREEAPGFFKIPFSDRTLAIKNTIQNQLLFNGFYRLNTKQYAVADFNSSVFDVNSKFIDILNQVFFRQYSQLTLFKSYYTFFVDPITMDVCTHYHLPTDICDLLIYASNLLTDNHFASENNASLYRIRSSEVIPALIHDHLAAAIARYTNQVGSKSRDNKLPWNPNEVVNDLVKINTVSPISALNPMVELHTREVISTKGFHGVNVDRAFTEQRRSYEESMIGKVAMSSPNNGEVGINRQLVVDPKIESVRGYTSTEGVDTDFNDLQLASFSELLTPGTVTRDDAIRTAIATSQTSHILPTNYAEPVLISNGIDEIVPSYLTDEFSVMAEEDGDVTEIKDDYMIVTYKSGKKQAIPVGSRYGFNQGSGFYVDNKLVSNFGQGDHFQKNDILAYHSKFFTKDQSGMVRLNIGPLAKVAFGGLYSTYEDAGLITHNMSGKLSSTISMCQASKLNATDDVDFIAKVGDEVEIGDPLIVFGLGDTGDKAVDVFLKAFQNQADLVDTAKRVIRSKHAGKIVDIKMYTVKSMDKLSPSLFEIFDEYFKENKKKRAILDKYDKNDSCYKLGTLYSAPTEPLKGSSIKSINVDVLIEFYIEHTDDVSVGDKCVVYAASKQVISEVIPQGLEPYAESTPDEEVSMFVSPGSVMKRMIPSIAIIAGANKVLIELKKQIRDIWNT